MKNPKQKKTNLKGNPASRKSKPHIISPLFRYRRHMVAAITVIGFAIVGSYVLITTNAAEPAGGYNVWAWNISGNKMNHESTTNGITSVAASSIVNRSADFVSFNEMCYGQYKDMQSRLQKAGWATANSYSRFAAAADFCSGQPYGLAVFSKYNITSSETTVLPSDGSNEKRLLLCVFIGNINVRFCSTHITTKNTVMPGDSRPINVVQLDKVKEKLESYNARGERVIIAGDFNAQPNYGRLNNWYSPNVNTQNNNGNTGKYRELDDTDSRCLGYGEVTVTDDSGSPCGGGKKIDLIFVRENKVAAYSGDSLSISQNCSNGYAYCSDHRILIGNVKLK